MSKQKSSHVYDFVVGSPLDYEEVTVEIFVDVDPTRETKVVQCSDGRTIEYSNAELVAVLQMEEGRDKVQIELLERATEMNLYLDEFIKALQDAKELLVK